MSDVKPNELLDRLAAQGIEWIIVRDGGAVGFHEWKGLCFLHCRIWAEWSMSARAECMRLWAAVVAEARRRGYDKIYVAQDLSDAKQRLFHRLFGIVQEVGRVKGHALMVKEIGNG